ncbi:hypothetical protein LIBAT_03175 [Leptospira interrogans]
MIELTVLNFIEISNMIYFSNLINTNKLIEVNIYLFLLDINAMLALHLRNSDR